MQDPPASRYDTHEVLNQPPPLQGFNAYLQDRPLREALRREGGGWGEERLAEYGALAGGELLELGFAANVNKPVLRLFDRFGHRLDEVEFHPAWHRLMTLGATHGLHSFAWRNAGKPGAHVVRAALVFLHGQAEQGSLCPLTMTYASVPTLRHNEMLAREWLPRVTSTEYDPGPVSAERKRGCLIGMGMTEKQGGSDVRANTTRAHPLGNGEYEIIGHKWFMSAPMCDGFLLLAHAEQGLSCFFMPRFRHDGTRNAIRIQRLKDKLGNSSNASSEVEFEGAQATLVGSEGRGVATIIEMVRLTRLDCIAGSAALMRQALTQAIHHARHRKAFGKLLIDQPLMGNVLADLAIESEAATALMLRVARAVDAAPRDRQEAAFARIATAIGKYWVCKRAPGMVAEALECLGGSGFVEESILPRLYRDAPLNSIWEGCGNIQCLDVLRALGKEPETRDAVFGELAVARGENSHLDGAIDWLQKALDDEVAMESRSRLIVERLALALQGSVLLRAGNATVAAAFCASRLGGEHGNNFGTLTASATHRALIDRAAIEV